MTAAPGAIALVAVLGLVYYRRARFFARLAREAHESHGARGLAVVGVIAAAFVGFTAFRLHLSPSGYMHYRLAMLAVGLAFALLLGVVALRLRRPAAATARAPEPGAVVRAAPAVRTYSVPVWFVGALALSGLLVLVGLMRELGGSGVQGGALVALALGLSAVCALGLKRARGSAGWPGLFTPPGQS